jgi:hypothetical protein
VKKATQKSTRAPRPTAPVAWPDREAATSLGITVREQLDYLAWIGEAAEAVGLHAGDQLLRWREAVQRAYDAFFDPMVGEHGDPLPPDVPPAVHPGAWPDVPAARIQGMTVRHQLTVIRTIAGLCRRHGTVHHQPAEIERWSRRVQQACDAMDHGASLPMPDEARSRPPQPPAGAKKKKSPPASAAAAKTPSKAPAGVASPAKKPRGRPAPAKAKRTSGRSAVARKKSARRPR